MTTLEVRYQAQRVGTIKSDAAGRFCFSYQTEWLASPSAFPVSVTLPLQAGEVEGGPAHAFFANLLPEGSVREAVCRRLGISEANDTELLRAIGGECAGALSIVDPAAPPADLENHYEELDPKRLRKLGTDEIVPLLIGGPTTRLSLAGAQDKLPVALIKGTLHLPIGASASTHILKLPNSRYAHMPVNEAYVLGLAAHVGMQCVSARLVSVTDPPSLLVERYDRLTSADPWPVRRIHQEDLCQALGLPPSQKYEQEGGPSFAQVLGVMRRHVVDPLRDVQRLIEWQAFNVVVGNSDGHGKNLSIVYDDGAARLAPFYDLLCTREYARVDRSLAMSVGGRRDPDQLDAEQWARFAIDSEMRPRVVLDIVGSVVARISDDITEWTKEFRDANKNPPILQTLPKRIVKQARRVARGLAHRVP